MSDSPKVSRMPGAKWKRGTGIVAALMVLAVGVIVCVSVTLRASAPKPGQVDKVRDNFPYSTGLPVGHFTEAENWAVIEGRLVQAFWNKGEGIVMVGPPSGNRQHSLYRVTRPWVNDEVSGGFVTYTETGVCLHELVRQPIPLKPIPLKPRPRGATTEYIRPDSTFYRLPGSLPEVRTGQTRESIPIANYVAQSWKTQIISLDGTGRTVDILPQTSRGTVVGTTAVGNMAFWWESEAKERWMYTRIQDGKPRVRIEEMLEPAQTTLYGRSLSGGAPRRLATGLTSPRDLIPLNDGLAFFQNHDYPDKRRDLLVLRPPDYRPVRIPNFPGTFPVFAGGRIWWLEAGKEPQNATSANYDLVSLKEDGADPRRTGLVFGTESRSSAMFWPTLSAYRNRIYVMSTRDAERQSHTIMPVDAATGKIEPAIVDNLAYYCPVEENRVDNGYLYFVREETQRSPFDVFQERGTERVVKCLFRVRLPE